MWRPVDGLEGPCGDISYQRTPSGELIVTMHFSFVKGLPTQDLQISFRGACALHWEDECPGFFPSPNEMAKCTDPKWNQWVFPLQKIEESELLREHRSVRELGSAPRLVHYFLISMNDLVHVVAHEMATAEWVPGAATAEGEA